MSDLRGYVSEVSKFRIHGWALCESDPSRSPELEIIQKGRTLFTIIPNGHDPAIRPVLKMPPYNGLQRYRWKLMLPLAGGLIADVPFTIRFRETREPLSQGADREIKLFENIDEEALRDLNHTRMLAVAYSETDQDVIFRIKAFAKNLKNPRVLLNEVEVAGMALEAAEPGVLYGFEKAAAVVSVKKNDVDAKEAFCSYLRVAADDQSTEARYLFHSSLRQIAIPRTVHDVGARIFPVPEPDRVNRVAAVTDTAAFFIGGCTVFMQLDAMSRHYLGKSVTDLECVVDWGVGCGRVARHFFETAPKLGLSGKPRVIGCDIDRYNVDWCQNNLEMGTYTTLSLNPARFPVPDNSVSLLYGISVLTHLSEHEQHIWLAEIQRVLQPGGIAILSIHAEPVYYRVYSLLNHPIVENLGICDIERDFRLGAELSHYYRGTYHSRKYIRDVWSRYGTVVDVIPAAQNFSQDYVILRVD